MGTNHNLMLDADGRGISHHAFKCTLRAPVHAVIAEVVSLLSVAVCSPFMGVRTRWGGKGHRAELLVCGSWI